MPVPEDSEIYGIAVNVPEAYSEKLMNAIDGAMDPVYPGYRRCFAVIPCKGTWKTLEGAHPFDGEVGKITAAEEIRIKFVCRKKDLKNVLRAIDRAHPYEEPAVDVVPQIAWRSLLRRSFSSVRENIPSKVF